MNKRHANHSPPIGTPQEITANPLNSKTLSPSGMRFLARLYPSIDIPFACCTFLIPY